MSKNLWEEQCKYVPNGTGTLSKMPRRYPSNYPTFLVKGSGGQVLSDTFKSYVDLISGLGAISVGYANKRINTKIQNQLSWGSIFSLSSPLEYEVAKKLTELLPETEMWKFGLNGTDGNVMAVRAARAYTRRTNIVTVGYNGCADVFECQGIRNAGIPEVLKAYNKRAFYNNKLSFCVGDLPACVLLEPMVLEYPQPGVLEWLREECTKNGIVLIFDEVVNGGRFKDFVSSAYFKIVPDLYVLGKGLANGLPLSAVGGKRSIMQTFERSDFFASGTFSTPCLSFAAALATMEILQETIDDRIENGMKIQNAFNSFNWPEKTECVGYPTRLDFRFPTKEHKFLFWQEMCNKGVLIGYTNFVMADHSKHDIDTVISGIHDSFRIMKEHWGNPRSKLADPMPEEALLRKN